MTADICSEFARGHSHRIGADALFACRLRRSDMDTCPAKRLLWQKRAFETKLVYHLTMTDKSMDYMDTGLAARADSVNRQCE